jgi:glycosyltransferase involved in cell wall biosynthesis
MTKEPLVSIITVTFNSAATVKRTIESVKQQTYTNIEYIIIDGASKDNTVEICENNLIGSKTNFKIISEPDSGIYDAMNKGLRMATGDIVGIINSDDWYEANAVEIIVNNILKNGPGVYYGLLRKIIDNKEYFIERLHHDFLNLTMIPHASTFLTADIYKKYGLFDLKYKFVADYDLIIRLKKADVPFYTIDTILSNFTVGGASASYKASLESIRLRYDNGFLSKRSYLLKKIKILIVNKYLKF